MTETTTTPATASSTIALTKHHGLGNDFLVAVDPSRPFAPDDAVAWCDRRRGIGADGLIELSSGSDDTGAQLWTMRMWNSDGSQPEISGNGMRCVGQALARHIGAADDGLAEGDDHHLLVNTDAGLRQVHVRAGDGSTRQVRVDMGAPGAGPADSDAWGLMGVWVDRQLGVDMGNPHLVALVENPAGIDMERVGPMIEADYPDGLNVHVVKVENPSTITMNIWERGAGLTEACGSGACAAAYATNSWGLTDPIVKVEMPGGSAEVEVGSAESGGSVHLTGPASFVAEVIVDS